MKEKLLRDTHLAETGQEQFNVDMLDFRLYDEDDLIMISALQHYLFCPRQCALIHLEQQWLENRLTAEGRILHERVHGGGRETHRTLRIGCDVPIRSLRLGLTGRADIVEFHRREDGLWQPLPVEYKRGRPKKDDSDRVQLCAQAICLEEMMACPVPEGSIYYGEKKRRSIVAFDAVLRVKTIETADAVHRMLDAGKTPPPVLKPACEHCSFIESCLPHVLERPKPVHNYLAKMIGDS